MEVRRQLKKFYVAFIRLINSKNDYRFFLKSTFLDIDTQIAVQLAATNVFGKHINRISIKAPFGQSVLVIAPHQDDEAVGCGGAIIQHAATGKPVYPVFVHDGVGNPNANPKEKAIVIKVREDEALEAARIGGFQPPIFLRHSTLSLASLEPVVESFVKVLTETHPDTIFTPFILDPDGDHAVSNIALALALERTTLKCRVLGYEVWSLCFANVGVAIDDVIDKKTELISVYKSQLASTDYVHTTLGLNMLHSRVFNEPGSRYVENYFELPSNEFIAVTKKISLALKSR